MIGQIQGEVSCQVEKVFNLSIVHINKRALVEIKQSLK